VSSFTNPSDQATANVYSYTSGVTSVAALEDVMEGSAVVVNSVSQCVDSMTSNKFVLCNVATLEDSEHIDSVISSVMNSDKDTVVGVSGVMTSSAKNRAVNARRLADANAADGDATYYVHMTPNILTGILFMILFTTVILVGTGCMNQIVGQTVFVSKQPAVGKEM
jgi:hypothetical protein